MNVHVFPSVTQVSVSAQSMLDARDMDHLPPSAVSNGFLHRQFEMRSLVDEGAIYAQKICRLPGWPVPFTSVANKIFNIRSQLLVLNGEVRLNLA